MLWYFLEWSMRPDDDDDDDDDGDDDGDEGNVRETSFK